MSAGNMIDFFVKSSSENYIHNLSTLKSTPMDFRQKISNKLTSNTNSYINQDLDFSEKYANERNENYNNKSFYDLIKKKKKPSNPVNLPYSEAIDDKKLKNEVNFNLSKNKNLKPQNKSQAALSNEINVYVNNRNLCTSTVSYANTKAKNSVVQPSAPQLDQEMLKKIERLKNYNSIGELFNRETNDFSGIGLGEEIIKKHPIENNQSVQQAPSIILSQKERQKLDMIEKMNKEVEKNEMKLIGKKRKPNNSSNIIKLSKEFIPGYIWCSRCSGYHEPDAHSKLMKVNNIASNSNTDNNASFHTISKNGIPIAPNSFPKIKIPQPAILDTSENQNFNISQVNSGHKNIKTKPGSSLISSQDQNKYDSMDNHIEIKRIKNHISNNNNNHINNTSSNGNGKINNNNFNNVNNINKQNKLGFNSLSKKQEAISDKIKKTINFNPAAAEKSPLNPKSKTKSESVSNTNNTNYYNSSTALNNQTEYYNSADNFDDIDYELENNFDYKPSYSSTNAYNSVSCETNNNKSNYSPVDGIISKISNTNPGNTGGPQSNRNNSIDNIYNNYNSSNFNKINYSPSENLFSTGVNNNSKFNNFNTNSNPNANKIVDFDDDIEIKKISTTQNRNSVSSSGNNCNNKQIAKIKSVLKNKQNNPTNVTSLNKTHVINESQIKNTNNTAPDKLTRNINGNFHSNTENKVQQFSSKDNLILQLKNKINPNNSVKNNLKNNSYSAIEAKVSRNNNPSPAPSNDNNFAENIKNNQHAINTNKKATNSLIRNSDSNKNISNINYNNSNISQSNSGFMKPEELQQKNTKDFSTKTNLIHPNPAGSINCVNINTNINKIKNSINNNGIINNNNFNVNSNNNLNKNPHIHPGNNFNIKNIQNNINNIKSNYNQQTPLAINTDKHHQQGQIAKTTKPFTNNVNLANNLNKTLINNKMPQRQRHDNFNLNNNLNFFTRPNMNRAAGSINTHKKRIDESDRKFDALFKMDKDDFICDDDDGNDEVVQRHLASINKKLSRGISAHSYIPAQELDDVEEADFYTQEVEERKTLIIAELEDLEEELREKRLKEQKMRKRKQYINDSDAENDEEENADEEED